MTADDVINIRRLQADIPMLGRKIAAPDDGQTGVPGFQIATQRDGLAELRPGHNGYG